MGNIIVAGLINIETTLRIEGFPVEYSPIRQLSFDIHSSPSGVGYNIAKALTTLGDTVHFLSLLGKDTIGTFARETLLAQHISDRFALTVLSQNPQSVILYDKEGNRQINTDLKDVQKHLYPLELFEEAIENCSLAVLCNINFARPLLQKTQQRGILIASDLHAIGQLKDDYNKDFMYYSNILFMSDERLPVPPEEWTALLQKEYGAEIIVIGMGAQGALLTVRQDNFCERIPAVYTRKIVNTVGAGDAFFASFIHFYNQRHDPYDAIQKAMVFASYKIGVVGGADGFLNEAELLALYQQISRMPHNTQPAEKRPEE